MTIINDQEIRKRSMPHFLDKPLITPFSEPVSGKGIISYGLTSAGYDLRLSNRLVMFKTGFHIGVEAIDPKLFITEDYINKVTETIDVPVDSDGRGKFIIPPHGYVMGRSLEYFHVHSDLKGRCTGKSTLARCGIMVNTTPLEPGWCGHLVIELANLTGLPVVLYIGEGVAQVEFDLINKPETDYSSKGGKYQGQTGVTLAKVKQ